MNDKIYVYMKKGENLSLINFLLEKASHGHEPYYDLYTDSDRDYIAFNQLKRDIEKEKGLLIISSINNIGSNKNDVFKELAWLKNNHIETIFADYPATQIFDNPAANELALSVIIDVYASLLDNKTFPESKSTEGIVPWQKIKTSSAGNPKLSFSLKKSIVS